MPRHPGLPRPEPVVLERKGLLSLLEFIDKDAGACERVLAMETSFRMKVGAMIDALPASEAKFEKFNTSPYVLLFYAAQQGYQTVGQIEGDIVPAKVFSSMETSAGRMIEEVTLPAYGWDTVPSGMHTAYSSLDGRLTTAEGCEVATLKSGPRCLNDEMSENFADNILSYGPEWSSDVGASKVVFNYGVLYGTPRQSNKKDWHILRQLVMKTSERQGSVVRSHENSWTCEVQLGGITYEAAIRIGLDWWQHLGGPTCALEVWVAMIRACIVPGATDPADHHFIIGDIKQIISTDVVPPEFNVGLLQRSQLPWLFFVARHFCDRLA